MVTVIWRNKTDSSMLFGVVFQADHQQVTVPVTEGYNMTEMQFDNKNKYQVVFSFSREGKFYCFVLKDDVL